MLELTNHRERVLELWLLMFIILFMVLVAQRQNELQVRTSQLKDLASCCKVTYKTNSSPGSRNLKLL